MQRREHRRNGHRQSEDGGVPAYAGAGLGLAISKAIVDGLGGEIRVETKAGRGSCFSFWIPAPPTAAEEPEKIAARFRVLVADTDSDARELIARALAPLNMEVLSAADDETARKLAAREPVDLVVADLELARTSGRTGFRRVRGRGGRKAAAPVIALAEAADDALYAEVLAEGFHGLVAKPLSRSELVSAIALALAVSSSAP